MSFTNLESGVGGSVDSSEITDGSIVNADINNTAAIAESKLALKKVTGWSQVGSGTAVSTGDGTVGIPITAELNGYDITNVTVAVHDKGVTGTTDVQIRRRRAGADVDVLSTKVTLGDEFYVADGVVDTSNDDLQTGDVLYYDVDAVHSGTAPNGLYVAVTCQLP